MRIFIISFIILSFLSCSRADKKVEITFDVGFEEVKSHQGVFIDNTGEEEVYFVKLEYTPRIKFYNLEGSLTDSISLSQIEKEMGRISRISLISKDSILVISYAENKMACINRRGEHLFIFDLARADNEANYKHYGAIAPTILTIKDDLFLTPYWCGLKNDTVEYKSYYDLFSFFYEQSIRSPQLLKIESVFSDHPIMKYALQDFYYSKSTLLNFYTLGSRYIIANNNLIFYDIYDRYIHIIDTETMNIQRDIFVIPETYDIPVSCALTKENAEIDTTAEEMKEINAKSYISNILYSNITNEYFVFIKTGTDHSTVDESGYPFIVVVYDNDFNEKRTVSFEGDNYLPHSSLMTTKGILIEKKQKEYGKRIYEVLNI